MVFVALTSFVEIKAIWMLGRLIPVGYFQYQWPRMVIGGSICSLPISLVRMETTWVSGQDGLWSQMTSKFKHYDWIGHVPSLFHWLRRKAIWAWRFLILRFLLLQYSFNDIVHFSVILQVYKATAQDFLRIVRGKSNIYHIPSLS